MSSRFLDVRRMYRPLEPAVDRPAVLAERARLAELTARDSAEPSSPATNVLTFVRPNLSESLGLMAPSREAMSLNNSNTSPRAQSLEAAYLLLVERAGSAAFARGAEACASFVASVADGLSSDDPGLVMLRNALPEVAQAERDAKELLAIRCAVCTVGNCPRTA